MPELISIYIPRVSFESTEEFVKETLNKIGIVERVIFKRVKKNNTYRKVKSAIVYFREYYENILSIFIKQCIEKGKSYIYYTTKDRYEYWILLKNNVPLIETNNNKNNNYQMEDYCNFLEKKIDTHEEKIKDLENSLESLHKIVFSMLGI